MPTTGVSAPSAAFQPTSGAIGSWTWIDVEAALAQVAAGRGDAPAGKGERLETAPLAPNPTVRPSGIR